MVFGKKTHSKTAQNNSRAEIEQTSSFRYLGLIIDNQLKIKDHINYVKEKLLKCCSLFLPITPYFYKNTAS